MNQDVSELFERAQRVLPGGVNSPVRAMRQIGRDPIFIDSGKGCEITDREGNTYIDWIFSWGPLILGHADPDVIAAVNAAAAKGTTFGAATESEVQLAEEIASRMPSGRDDPWADLIRYRGRDECRSGWPAPSPAARSWSSSPAPTTGIPTACCRSRLRSGDTRDPGLGLGVPAAQTADTVVVPWNDTAAVAEALEKFDVAALLVEPRRQHGRRATGTRLPRVP